MHSGRKGIGSHKHGKSGIPTKSTHFTGVSKGSKVRRKGSTRKQRKMNRGTHINKYSNE
jgi:hypothetical protein